MNKILLKRMLVSASGKRQLAIGKLKRSAGGGVFVVIMGWVGMAQAQQPMRSNHH